MAFQSAEMMFFGIILVIALFLLVAYLIQVTYNHSVVEVNSNWSQMSYQQALVFTLFLWFIGMVLFGTSFGVVFSRIRP